MITLSKEQVLMMHKQLITATGGSDGIRDEGMLDGNKRLGAHVMLVFLMLNGYELAYDQKELVDIILKLAAGEKM